MVLSTITSGVASAASRPVIEKPVAAMTAAAPGHLSVNAAAPALILTMAPTRAATLAGAAPSEPKDGDFIRSSAATGIYRIAGGAPILVTTWKAFGGPKSVRTITAAQWRNLSQRPAEGTFLRSTGGQIFRVIGGAPVYVRTMYLFGPGPHPAITVDEAAITEAGSSAALGHLRAYPADGTFIIENAAGHVYRMAGGAPIYVPSWSTFGGRQPAIYMDGFAINYAGRGGVYSHLHLTPIVGTYLEGVPGGKAYRIDTGGHPVQIGHNNAAAVPVAQAVIDKAGDVTAPFNNLL